MKRNPCYGWSLAVIVMVAFYGSNCLAQSDSTAFNVTGAVKPIPAGAFGVAPSGTVEPFSGGLIAADFARTLIRNLGADTEKTTIIHLVRWSDASHNHITFQKWYLYDPSPTHTSFYLQSKQSRFERAAIPGRRDFQFLYVHLNANLAAGESEWAAGDQLKPNIYVSYTITVTKAATQFIQDLTTLLKIALAPAVAAAPAISPGFYSFSTFSSVWSTSTIMVAGSFTKPGSEVQGSTAAGVTAAPQVTGTQTYLNEKPSWIGLSAGVPITTYKDVKYDSSAGSVAPSSVTRRDVYVFLDGYIPPVLPSLTAFRYIPHPFFGLPLKGAIFRHPMLGLGIGLRWAEPFGGFVFDTETQDSGPQGGEKGLHIKAVFGLKFSIGALAKALNVTK